MEGATVGHVDGRAKQELDMVGGVALGSEFVMHGGLVSIGVDFLAADHLYLVMKLVQCEAGTEWLGRLQIDRYIVLIDEAIGDAARAVGRMASGGNDRSERRDENKPGAAVTKEESAGCHDFFLKRASSLFCAPVFVFAGLTAASPGMKYSQKLNRSLSTTRSAMVSRQLLL